jgi:phospholipase/carboxylesterase
MLKLFGELEAQGVAPADTYLFGFSQGCLVAVDAGLRHEKILGGICGVSGYLAFEEEYPEALSPAALRQGFLVTHGLRDPVVPFEPAARQFQRLQKLGLQIDFRPYDKDHTILSEELRDIAEWFRGRL